MPSQRVRLAFGSLLIALLAAAISLSFIGGRRTAHAPAAQFPVTVFPAPSAEPPRPQHPLIRRSTTASPSPEPSPSPDASPSPEPEPSPDLGSAAECGCGCWVGIAGISVAYPVPQSLVDECPFTVAGCYATDASGGAEQLAHPRKITADAVTRSAAHSAPSFSARRRLSTPAEPRHRKKATPSPQSAHVKVVT